ncbi:RNA 2',3'-cyclic phosphodiesterase [Streptomyces sp. NPDC050560]|uniref:RNA 2',3'-cyclic phosphodiesterase n=1 Tax=Streptomyces sp. NPDC050560 TaxID=3365630 RepID=UPI00378B0565
MRLFAALVPPADVLDAVAAAVAGLRAALPDEGHTVRWSRRESWHLTLAFYGEADGPATAVLADRLGRAAARTAPFRIGLGGGGHFGDTVLWTGAGGDLPALRRLAERAAAAGRRAGLPGEERRYRPHLTLARARTLPGLPAAVSALDGFTTGDWTVRELVLLGSELPRSGVPGERPRYTQVDRRPLGGAG